MSTVRDGAATHPVESTAPEAAPWLAWIAAEVPEPAGTESVVEWLQRLQDGFDLEEVVAEYNILRGCIHDLADRNGLSLQGQAYHILNPGGVFVGARFCRIAITPGTPCASPRL